MLIIQISLLILTSLSLGIGLGWWFGRVSSRTKNTIHQAENEQIQSDLQQAKRDIQLLKIEKQQATAKIETYSQHFNSDIYGDYLHLREQLANCQAEFAQFKQENPQYLTNRLTQVA